MKIKQSEEQNQRVERISTSHLVLRTRFIAEELPSGSSFLFDSTFLRVKKDHPPQVSNYVLE